MAKKPLAENKGKNEIVKDKIRDYLANTWEELINDIDSLDAKERVDRRMRLLDYVMPKVQAVKGEEKKTMSISQAILRQEDDFEDYVEEDDTNTNGENDI